MEEIIQFIANVGFPCFMATYVVMRTEPTIKQLIEAVTKITTIVSKYHDE